MQLQPAMFPFVRLHLPSIQRSTALYLFSLYKIVAFLALQLAEHSQQILRRRVTPSPSYERVTIEISQEDESRLLRATIMRLADLAGFKVNTGVGLLVRCRHLPIQGV